MTDVDRRVTQEDIDLVLESMIRQETGTLKIAGLVAEIIGWLAVAGSILFGFVQWGEMGSFSNVNGDEIERWRSFVGFLFPTMINLMAGGALLVVAGRAARLFALHQAARRGINVTGLTLGEPLDLDLDDEDDPS